jgi:hypothetical protein
MPAQALLGELEQFTHRYAGLHAVDDGENDIPHPIVLGLLAR